jgi:hypothetical protein
MILRIDNDCSLLSTQRIVLFGFITVFRKGGGELRPAPGDSENTFLELRV